MGPQDSRQGPTWEAPLRVRLQQPTSPCEEVSMEDPGPWRPGSEPSYDCSKHIAMTAAQLRTG